MQVSVTYTEPAQQVWLRIEVPDGTCVADAIRLSGILDNFPQVDLAVHKVGVFGKVVKLDAPLRSGDRVEIYRAITCDPKAVPRRGGSAEDDDE